MVRCRARFMQLVSLSFETQHFAVLVRASLLQLVELVALLRETLLQDGTWQQLWRFATLPGNQSDTEVLMAVLRLAPPDAPERTAALVRLEALGS